MPGASGAAGSPPLAIVQARMSSSRLPGKSLADIGGEPALDLLIGRLRRARTLGRVVVATSTEDVDDPIAEAAERLGCQAHRGSRDDVLERFVGASEGHDGPVVRITGDCPLIDPSTVDAVVELFAASPGVAYAGNVEPRRTYPKGLDVEVVAAPALREAARDFSDPESREHVTLALRRHPERFPRVSLEREEDLGELRWTVDEADDLEFVRAVVERLGVHRYEAGIEEILAAVRAEPSLASFRGVRG